MCDTDERIEADDVEINAKRVVVTTGWTPRMAWWNTLGTVLGAFVGLASLVLSAAALYVALLH